MKTLINVVKNPPAFLPKPRIVRGVFKGRPVNKGIRPIGTVFINANRSK